jgi:hypothetical protein
MLSVWGLYSVNGRIINELGEMEGKLPGEAEVLYSEKTSHRAT